MNELIKKYRSIINPPYNPKDVFIVIATLLLLVAIPVTVISLRSVRDTRSKAAVLPTGPCYPFGDVSKDGKVTVTDSLIISRYVAGLQSLTQDNLNLADANADDRVDSIDALKIQRYIVGLDKTFAICKPTGTYIILDLFPEHLATLNHPMQWLKKLDEAYAALKDLTGGLPHDGDKITIKETSTYPGGALVAGNPILWWSEVVPNDLKSINEKNDLSFGPIHELSHDFDVVPYSYAYIEGRDFPINSEQWANFKLTYVADTLAAKYPTATFTQGGIYYLLGNFSHKYFVEKFAKPWLAKPTKDRTAMNSDTFTGLLYMLKEQYGWIPFIKTFKQYNTGNVSYPKDLEATTSAGSAEDFRFLPPIRKFLLFADVLQSNGVPNAVDKFKSWKFVDTPVVEDPPEATQSAEPATPSAEPQPATDSVAPRQSFTSTIASAVSKTIKFVWSFPARLVRLFR